MASFVSCSFRQNTGKGLEASSLTGLTLLDCSFSGNRGGIASDQANALDASECERLEVRSCGMEDAQTGSSTARAEQFVRLSTCQGAVVDGCRFDGLSDSGARKRPQRAVRFVSCPWARLSNNTAEGMVTEFVLFDTNCNEATELGNRKVENPIPRFTFTADARVFGLSRRAVGLHAHLNESMLPGTGDVAAGSVCWIKNPNSGHSKLQIWDGSNWKNIALS